MKIVKNWCRGGAGASGRSKWGVIVPGPTCPVAADAAIDTTYAAIYPAAAGVQQWWRFPLSPGTNHWTVTGITGTGVFAAVIRGTDCTHFVNVTTQFTDGHRTFSNPTSDPFAWIIIDTSVGGVDVPYTLNVGPGA